MRKQHWPTYIWSLRREAMGRRYARTDSNGDILLVDVDQGEIFRIRKADARLWARRINQIRDKQTGAKHAWS